MPWPVKGGSVRGRGVEGALLVARLLFVFLLQFLVWKATPKLWSLSEEPFPMMELFWEMDMGLALTEEQDSVEEAKEVSVDANEKSMGGTEES